MPLDAALGTDFGAELDVPFAHGLRMVSLTHFSGTDFDGFVTTPFDAIGLPPLTQAMLDANFDPRTIRRILGGNLLRVLGAALPP